MISSLCARGEKTSRIIGQVRTEISEQTDSEYDPLNSIICTISINSGMKQPPAGDGDSEEDWSHGCCCGSHPDASTGGDDRGEGAASLQDNRQKP